MKPEEMTLEQLYEYREQLMEDINELDGQEPFDESSEEFVAWAEEHEELEDLLDDVVDRIEELGGELP